MKQPGWLRRLLGAPRPRAPLPTHLWDFRSTSDALQRLQLFEKWLEYESGQEGGFVVFESDRRCFVQFARGPEPGRCVVEVVGGRPWEDLFGEPQPESARVRLSARGFQPPDGGSPNFALSLEGTPSSELAQLTEWAFREALDEEPNFAAKVAAFGP